MPVNAGRSAASVAGRLIAAILGGYAFSASIATFVAVALPVFTEVSRADASVTMGMLAFLIYLAAAIWALSARRLACLYLVFSGGSVLLFLAAHGLMRLTNPA